MIFNEYLGRLSERSKAKLREARPSLVLAKAKDCEGEGGVDREKGAARRGKRSRLLQHTYILETRKQNRTCQGAKGMNNKNDSV